jgi:Stage II sporulation protein E (SpoIIE)
MATPSAWRNTPRRSAIIFLLAVFFVFASFGFASDVIDMGLQPPLRFALSVLLSGVFAVSYAASGVALRGKFWKAFLPLFALHFACMAWLGNRFPEAPRPHELGVVETGHLQGRLVFDGLAMIVSVCLGYAGFVYVSISEGRRHIRSQMEKATLEGEMSAAREVQRVMVPEVLPHVDGYAIENVYLPAAEVGGDFFQVIPLKSGRALVVIGDVSGKGLRAAMIVSMIVGTLHAVSGYTEEPSEILGELNRRLCGSMNEGFATCLVVRLEDSGRLMVANAGHLPPYVNGTEVELTGSLPLGVAQDTAYEQTSLQMAAGNVMVLVTDGVAEAHNDKRELLGFAKVEQMLHAGATAKIIAAAAQGHGQNDDITVLSVTRLG